MEIIICHFFSSLFRKLCNALQLLIQTNEFVGYGSRSKYSKVRKEQCNKLGGCEIDRGQVNDQVGRSDTGGILDGRSVCRCGC